MLRRRLLLTPRVEALESRQLLSAALPDHVVRIAYLIPSNRTEQPGAVATLRNAIKWYQDFFAEQMERNGFGRKSFAIETAADGVTPVVNVRPLPMPDSYYREEPWGRVITDARDAAEVNVWGNGETWLLFFEGHIQTPDGMISGGSAGGGGYGDGDGGGVAVLGSDMIELMKSSYLTDQRPYAGLTIPALGPYPLAPGAFIDAEGSTMSSVASSRIGAVAHELGHAFGLAHGFRNDENFHGNLMGNGLRGFRGNLLPEQFPADWTRLEYADALMLSTSRFFNAGSTWTDNIAPAVTAKSGSIENGSLKITISATDDGGLSSVLLDNDSLGILDQAKLDGTSATATFSIPNYEPQSDNLYRFFVYDKAGNRRETEFTLSLGSVANRAPSAFMKILAGAAETPKVGQSVTLDASNSFDPEYQSMKYEWDLNGDGVFDTGLLNSAMYSTSFSSAGTRMIQLRVTDASGAKNISAPIGIRVTGSIPPADTGLLGGGVFNDSDGDGQRDLSEGGISGVKVYLDANKNRVLDAGERFTLTDIKGDYDFDDLAAGKYRVAVLAPSGMRQTTTQYLDGTVYAGKNSSATPVGLSSNILISGKCFDDADGDGVKDAAEAPLPNWVVYIDANNNGMHDEGRELGVATDSSGNWSFKSLPAGSYRVRLAAPKEWRYVRPTSAYRDITLASGSSAVGQDFAVTRNVLITGTLFNDVNVNGTRDRGDGICYGWTVYIDANRNGKLDAGERSVSTDAQSRYAFTDLPAGSYRIRAVTSTWRFVNPTWGYYDINPKAGATVTGKDFAVTPKVLLSGTVFNDANGDGVKQSTESALSAWRVYIDANNDGKWQSTERNILSDASGKWAFKDLVAGTYRVRIVQQSSSWKLTTPKSGYHLLTLGIGASVSGKLFGEHKIV